MTYIGYEEVKPAVVHRRIIPTLRKYYRSDSSFDLFDTQHNQINCLRYLCTHNEAGFVCSRGYNSYGYGTYSIGNLSVNESTPIRIRLTTHSNVRYGAYTRTGLKLSIRNSAGLFPNYIWVNGWGDKGGSWSIQYHNISNNSMVSCQTESNIWRFGNGIIFDWQDTDYIQVQGEAKDTSKYTNANAGIDLNFIHRYTQGHPLYRYYM